MLRWNEDKVAVGDSVVTKQDTCYQNAAGTPKVLRKMLGLERVYW
jgi:hypothetical protein